MLWFLHLGGLKGDQVSMIGCLNALRYFLAPELRLPVRHLGGRRDWKAVRAKNPGLQILMPGEPYTGCTQPLRDGKIGMFSTETHHDAQSQLLLLLMFLNALM